MRKCGRLMFSGVMPMALGLWVNMTAFAKDSLVTLPCGASVEVASEVAIEECQFRQRINKFRKDSYEGIGQFILGSNLAQPIAIKFTESFFGPEAPIQFNMSHFHFRRTPDDLSFPLEGSVQFEIRSAKGELTPFIDAETGNTILLGAHRFRFYVVETKRSFEERIKRAHRSAVVPIPEMPFIAVGTADMGQVQMTFFERSRRDPYVLVKRGVFKGK